MMRQAAGTGAPRIASAGVTPMTGIGGGPGEGWYAGFDGSLICVVTVANLRKLDAASNGGDMALRVCAEFIRRARHLTP
jgi:hypothetical protein